MQPRLSRLRRGWAVLAAGAVVASLLAVGATTATAVTDTPDEKSPVTACLGEALTDRNFTDVSDNHVFHDPINCLAHYGITIGCGDGTIFCPEEPVKRWQMMLFLARALEPAGINLSQARPQNFTDLGNLNDEARNAIDLLVTNRIADPAGPRTFDPNGIVNRTEMAQLLVRFLDAAGPVVDTDSNGNFLLDANGDGIRSRPDDYFQDASNSVSRLEDAAISAAYELGITTGVSATPASGTAQPGLDLYYEPFGDVTRGQMAAFILRTLGHTLARPIGLSAQYDGNEIRVSLRDDDFEPVDRAPVDMFYIETDDADRAFTSRGLCDEVESVVGTLVCEIDSSDLVTDNHGEVALNVPQTISDGTDTTVWVWTGRDGDEVGRRTDLVRLDVAPSEQPQGATTAEISTTFRGSKARFGVTVSFTVQLQDSNGNDVGVGLDGQRPAEWTLTEELLQDATVDGDPDSASAVKSKRTRTVRSDSRGQVTFSVSEQRTSLCTANSCTRTFKLTELSNAPAVAVNRDLVKRSSSRSDGDVYFLEFSSAAPVLTNAVVTLTVLSPYVNVPDRFGAIANTAIVTVHNEYGEALSAATASLGSDRRTNLNAARRFTIGGDGLHRFNYRYDGLGGEVETLTVTVDPDGSGSAGPLGPRTALVYWPVLTDTSTTNSNNYILFGDTSRNELIVDMDASTYRTADAQPVRVVYDSNHRFDVQGANDDEPVPVNSIEDFEKALAAYLANSPETNACLQWSGYDPDRPRRVATFELHRCP